MPNPSEEALTQGFSSNEKAHAIPPTHSPHGLLLLGVLSLLVGAGVGLLCAGFRLALAEATRFRDVALAWAHTIPGGVVLILAGCATAAATAAWLVRRLSPHAAGSGIPHVELVLNGEIPPAPFLLLPVKFLGGVLAMGAGLALGREGPSVQMGASIAHLVGHVFRRKLPDCLVLLAAGAGAGLATAFNAPIAGAVFVLEELARRFDTRITIATLGASTGAIVVSRWILGDLPDFSVQPLPYHGFSAVPLHLALGLFAGFLGVAYNRAILGSLALMERLRRLPVELRAALVGTAVGLVAWFGPTLVGGGEVLTQRTLDGKVTLQWLALVYLLRFALGPVSYAARTPGGLFAPLLVLGAQMGMLFGLVCVLVLPNQAPDPLALAVVGMAAFFTAVVRAPVTGIILITEMTGSFTLLLPLLSACFTAMLVPTLFQDEPIYDSLRVGTLRIQKEREAEDARA